MGDRLRVSIIMPVLNEERRLPRALGSIVAQDFPKELVEVLVADGGSTDRSVKIVESFSDRLDIKILDNSVLKACEPGKTLALQHASGDVVQLLDADAWFVSSATIRRLIEPLRMDSSLAGSIAPYRYVPELSLWSRYLSLDEFQRDPLLEKLTPDIASFVVERHSAYDVCEFSTTRIPPIGQTTAYWRETIDPTGWDGVWRDIDHPVRLIKQGSNRFAYVRSAGLAHEHCESVKALIQKRIRNPLVHPNGYMRMSGEPDFLWINPSDRREVFKLLAWLIGTNLLIPRIAEAIHDAIVLRRWEALLRPIAAVAVTDSLLWALIRSADGRRFIQRSLYRFLKR